MANKSPKLSNLKPYKKGQSGNPKGREKGSLNRSTLLRKWISTPGTFTDPVKDPEGTGRGRKMTPEDAVMLALIRKGMNGNMDAITEILNTLYGKVADKVENTNSGAQVIIQIPDNGRD